MPYVSETDTDNDLQTRTTTAPSLGASYTSLPLLKTGMFRSQYGWRSQGEEKASKEALKNLGPTQWSDTRRILEAMDRIQRAMTSPVARDSRGVYLVRDRRYRSVKNTGCFSPEIKLGPEGAPVWFISSQLNIDGTTAPIRSQDFIRATGSDLMRRSRPTQPSAGLAQFTGELRDFPRMFSRGSSGPISTRDIGSGHLGYVFGWLPFLSEIQAMADAVLESDKIVSQFLKDSGELVHRTNRRTLTNSSAVESNRIIYPNVSNFGFNASQASYSVGGVPVSLSWRAGLGNNQFRNRLQTVVNVNESVSSFAKFRYFAFDPDGFLARYQKYINQAQQVVGMNFDASVAYDLTPFTWLVDWFYDIGGFLSYQQSVADYNLAAEQCGVVYHKTVSTIVLCQPFYQTTGSWVVAPHPAWVVSNEIYQQRRYAGTPYDMGNTWSGFSPEQWFILGSLGLTNGPEIALW